MNEQPLAQVRVRDVMKTNFDLIDGRMTIAEALRAMKFHDNKSLIVDKRDDDDEYGRRVSRPRVRRSAAAPPRRAVTALA